MQKHKFDPRQSTPLCSIMGRHGSDKGNSDLNTSWHNYTTFYYSIFKDWKDKKIRIFELGLGTNNTNIASNMGKDGVPGASLHGWVEFFPNAKVFGADIDKDILFETGRIKTFYCDQTKPHEIMNMWKNSELLENFDIIIEDGLHTFEANVCFLENSIHKLKRGGYYIIEDIVFGEERRMLEKIEEWKTKFPFMQFTLLKIPHTRNNVDNTLLVVNHVYVSDWTGVL